MIFSKLPKFIEIEIGTYCNRICTWCPNGWNDRGRQKNSIKNTIWEAIINDLKSLNYSDWLAFHNYNEPLADPTIFDKISFVNYNLPNAKTAIYTNGDFLNLALKERLIELNVNEVRVTLYPKIKKKFETPNANKINQFAKNIGISELPQVFKGKRGLEAKVKIKNTMFHFILPLIKNYTDRAGAVKIDELKLSQIRLSPCFLPMHSAAIDYKGNLKLCCQIYDSDAEETSSFIIGNISTESFSELWFSDKMNIYRENAKNGRFEVMKPCHFCSYKTTKDQDLYAKSI